MDPPLRFHGAACSTRRSRCPGAQSPNNPFLGGDAATHPNSRGLEAMAITPNGKFLYAALEGATVADPTIRRHIFEFSTEGASSPAGVAIPRRDTANLRGGHWAPSTATNSW